MPFGLCGSFVPLAHGNDNSAVLTAVTLSVLVLSCRTWLL